MLLVYLVLNCLLPRIQTHGAIWNWVNLDSVSNTGQALVIKNYRLKKMSVITSALEIPEKGEEAKSRISSKEVQTLSERIVEQQIVIQELKTLKNIAGAKPKVFSKQPNILFRSDRQTELARAQKTLTALQREYDRLAK